MTVLVLEESHIGQYHKRAPHRAFGVTSSEREGLDERQ